VRIEKSGSKENIKRYLKPINLMLKTPAHKSQRVMTHCLLMKSASRPLKTM
jgi:hypothetical protein